MKNCTVCINVNCLDKLNCAVFKREVPEGVSISYMPPTSEEREKCKIFANSLTSILEQKSNSEAEVRADKVIKGNPTMSKGNNTNWKEEDRSLEKMDQLSAAFAENKELRGKIEQVKSALDELETELNDHHIGCRAEEIINCCKELIK